MTIVLFCYGAYLCFFMFGFYSLLNQPSTRWKWLLWFRNGSNYSKDNSSVCYHFSMSIFNILDWQFQLFWGWHYSCCPIKSVNSKITGVKGNQDYMLCPMYSLRVILIKKLFLIDTFNSFYRKVNIWIHNFSKAKLDRIIIEYKIDVRLLITYYGQ